MFEFVVVDFFFVGDKGLDDEGLGFEGFVVEVGGIDGNVVLVKLGEVFGFDGLFDEFFVVGLGVFVVFWEEDYVDVEVLIVEKGFFFFFEVFVEEFDGDLCEDVGVVVGDGVGVDGVVVGE